MHVLLRVTFKPAGALMGGQEREVWLWMCFRARGHAGVCVCVCVCMRAHMCMCLCTHGFVRVDLCARRAGKLAQGVKVPCLAHPWTISTKRPQSHTAQRAAARHTPARAP